MAFDFRCWNPLDVQHLGMKPMDLGAHVILTIRLGVPMRGLDVTERRLGPAGGPCEDGRLGGWPCRADLTRGADHSEHGALRVGAVDDP
jgi:hypothetical protein